MPQRRRTGRQSRWPRGLARGRLPPQERSPAPERPKVGKAIPPQPTGTREGPPLVEARGSRRPVPSSGSRSCGQWLGPPPVRYPLQPRWLLGGSAPSRTSAPISTSVSQARIPVSGPRAPEDLADPSCNARSWKNRGRQPPVVTRVH